MKIIIVCLLLTVTLNSGYANSTKNGTYHFNIKNNSRFEISLENNDGYGNCDVFSGYSPMKVFHIKPSQTFSFTYQENNCPYDPNDAYERIGFAIYPIINGIDPLANGPNYNWSPIRSTFIFQNQIVSGKWKLILYPKDSILQMSQGTCSGKNCINTYVDDTDNTNINIIYSANMKFATIGLGNIAITNGYGAEVTPIKDSSGQNRYPLDDNSEKYIVHFSKSLKTCLISENLINCSSSIGFTAQNDTIKFFCKQKSISDPQCPWTTVNDSQSLSHINIYKS
ncbi:MAG: hypothetical protein EP298_05400 [Gammaproteobacteria bacterium]|nr:MAG: hypothetical protein EP298_05400 [Gammaproteobacteria bacterium]UTW43232.1 hypothetical protein KFE69_03560 [bacterium SCSIO 12844]